MKINELIEQLKGDIHLNLEEVLEVRTYIPIAEKRAIAEDIISKISSTDNGYLQIDSVKRKICFETAMVKYHTNLDISDEDYDYIFENIVDGIDLYTLLKSCYKNDYIECAEILHLALDDMRHNYSIEASVSQLCNKVSTVIAGFSETLTSKVDGFNLQDILPNGVNSDDLMGLIEKYAK